MRKMLIAAAAFTLALLMCASAFASTVPSVTLEGLITEAGDGWFLMSDVTQGAVRVNLDDATTAYDGIAGKDAMAVGQYVYVTYNGIMTRSLPPQVTAQKVSCFVVNGTVTDILENGALVEGDTVLGSVIVHGYAGMPPLYQSVPVTLYYNGIMALSYPPQITVAYAVVPALTGAVSSAGTTGFTLTAGDGTVYTISVSAATEMQSLPANGEQVTVYYSGTPGENSTVTAFGVAAAQAAQPTATPN